MSNIRLALRNPALEGTGFEEREVTVAVTVEDRLGQLAIALTPTGDFGVDEYPVLPLAAFLDAAVQAFRDRIADPVVKT